MLLDTNAEFRQQELFKLKDSKQEDPLEVQLCFVFLSWIRCLRLAMFEMIFCIGTTSGGVVESSYSC